MMKLKWKVLVELGELHKFPMKWKLMIVDSEDDNFENVSSDEEGYQSGCDERDEFTFEINVDEELIKYAKDF